MDASDLAILVGPVGVLLGAAAGAFITRSGAKAAAEATVTGQRAIARDSAIQDDRRQELQGLLERVDRRVEVYELLFEESELATIGVQPKGSEDVSGLLYSERWKILTPAQAAPTAQLREACMEFARIDHECAEAVLDLEAGAKLSSLNLGGFLTRLAEQRTRVRESARSYVYGA